MIKHCVFLNLRADADLGALGRAIAELKALVGLIPGFLALDYGPNEDYESKSPDYDSGFVASFSDRQALANYDANPQHKAAGAVLVAQCNGGANGIFVVDLVCD
jgi:hypothetical protein